MVQIIANVNRITNIYCGIIISVCCVKAWGRRSAREKPIEDQVGISIGDRVIDGQIKERAEARRTYDNANAEGRKATLIEQERPNLFTNNVANVTVAEGLGASMADLSVVLFNIGAARWGTTGESARNKVRRRKQPTLHRPAWVGLRVPLCLLSAP